MERFQEIFKAIILGAVQGLTEFLPVSSSFHLRLVPALFGWPEMSLSFSAFLHLGTLCAILIYFGKDLWNIALQGWHDLTSLKFQDSLACKILIGSIPAILVGFFLHDKLEQLDRNLYLTSSCLIIIAFFLLASDLFPITRNSLNAELKPNESFIIGIGQALALIPGVSRSGSTITVGRFLGFKREEAARFSFLLGIPVILGAGLFESLKLFKHSAQVDLFTSLIGFFTAAIVGYLVIGFFLKFLQNSTLISFVIYRIIVGVSSLLLLFMGIIK